MPSPRVVQPALSQERILAASRALLVEGGAEAVVVREVARRLAVTAPALYRYVKGRDDLLTLLITACTDEMTDACAAAAAGAGEDPAQRLRAASWAFRGWALGHRAEFALLHGAPILGYRAPEGGSTTRARQRFADVFASIFAGLAAAGRLRVPAAVPEGLRVDLAGVGARWALTPAQLYVFVVGWQRMLGAVSTEVFGHIGWAFPDGEAFFGDQLEHLARELTTE